MRFMNQSPLVRRLGGVSAIAIMGVIGFASGTLAQGGDAKDKLSNTPGVPLVNEQEKSAAIAGTPSFALTGFGRKSIAASAFTPYGSSIFTGAPIFDGNTCRKSSTPAGTGLDAPIELPIGSRIQNVVFFGSDNNPIKNVAVRLYRESIEEGGTSAATRSTGASTLPITEFTTTGLTGTIILSSPGTLNELAGDLNGANAPHRFHTVEVVLPGDNLVLCGIEILYDFVEPANPGTTFFPITPARAYDSRQAAYAVKGPLAPNASRIVDVSAAHTAAGVVSLADVVPAWATAVTYNLTVTGTTGPNFLAITPGTSTSFVASAINFNGSADVANGGTVGIAADRTIKVWNGDQSGSTQFIVDITGFYAPTIYPNTAA